MYVQLGGPFLEWAVEVLSKIPVQIRLAGTVQPGLHGVDSGNHGGFRGVEISTWILGCRF